MSSTTMADSFLARYFPRMSVKRLRAEVRLLRHYFPSVKITLIGGGKIIAKGEIANRNDIRKVLIALPSSYPHRQPKLYIYPSPRRHVYLDGSICLHMNWRPTNTIAQLVIKAAELLWGRSR